jgi:nucleotide-binding universal stress UspA family protein
MGSHERPGMEKILIGSVAEKVLSHYSIPLLLVPPKHV